MIRCIECSQEFLPEQVKGAKACPGCGTESLPLNSSGDITLKINKGELRILTIWADNWARANCQTNSRRALDAILKRIADQVPGTPLTLSGEVRDLQEAGHDAALIQDGNVVVPFRGKPS